MHRRSVAPRADRGEYVVLLRHGTEQATPQATAARRHADVVDEYVELAEAAGAEFGLDAGLGFERGGETRRQVAVASTAAVFDADAHRRRVARQPVRSQTPTSTNRVRAASIATRSGSSPVRR